MNRSLAALLLGIGCLLSPPSTEAVTIDTVVVGNVGNAVDPIDGDSATPGIQNFGNVNYLYRMGQTEVTVRQYTAFLNAVAANDTYDLYNAGMAYDLNSAGISRSGVAGSYTYAVLGSLERPVTYVSWGDAARFANWLHNGQPGLVGPPVSQNGASTEAGAYALNGANTSVALNAIARSPGAKWVIPSENEWYKTAFHQPAAAGGDADNYWAYATRSNSVPASDQPPGGGAPQSSNTANFYEDDGAANGYNDGFAVSGSTIYSVLQNYLNDVKAYTSATSPYGTFDQAGNVWEWNEGLVAGIFRGMRGGSWDFYASYLPSTYRLYNDPLLEYRAVGFRVATIPEPSSLVLAAFGLFGFAVWGHRFNRSRP